MSGNTPQQKMPKLIVVAAFDRDVEGELVPAFDPREMQSADAAVRFAKMIEDHHAGVIAWSRVADPSVGEYGPPDILFQHGELPDME